MLPSVSVCIIVFIALTPLYLLGRLLWRQGRGGSAIPKEKERAREIGLLFFFLYLVFLLLATLWGDWDRYDNFTDLLHYAKWRIDIDYGINLEPFATIKRFYRYRTVNSRLFYTNVIGNCVLFIPLGFGIPKLWKKKYSIPVTILLAVVLPCIIEFLQLFIGRQVDVDDILLNFMGVMIGLMVH